MPGMLIDEDGLGTSVLASLMIAMNIGRMFGISEIESLITEHSDEVVIITPFSCNSLFLVVFARKTFSLGNLRRKINILINTLELLLESDTGWNREDDDASSQQLACNFLRSPMSLLNLSAVSMERISLLFQNFLRDFGYPEQLLKIDAKRREITEYLRCARAGIPDNDCIEFVSRICEVKGIPPIKQFLGKGFWGAVYMLTDDTVLKITKDEKEAQTCASINGKHNSCIVDIFQVYWVSINKLKTPYYFIIRENIDTNEMFSDEDILLLELIQQILLKSSKDRRLKSHEEIEDSCDRSNCLDLYDRVLLP